jgi:hypothetical protein
VYKSADFDQSLGLMGADLYVVVAATGFEPVTKIDRSCYSRSKMKHEIGGIDYDIYHSSIYRCLHCCLDA